LKKIRFKSAVSAAGFGVLIFAVFNAQVILGQVQYLTTPSGGIQSTSGSVNLEPSVGDQPRIIIPQIDVKVPVVYDEPSFKEEKVQKALQRGVVHYGTTAKPGENGNTVIVGHSSNNWWDSGKYKFAFILLDKMQRGDEIVLHYQGTRYVYKVQNKKVVEPTNTSVLEQTQQPRLTLITCTPPGTSWQRLIVQAKQVTPDPSQNTDPKNNSGQDSPALPSDSSRSFFEFMGDLF
jgi:sortase A